MVDKTMRELVTHGEKGFPVAIYDWHGPDVDGLVLECHWHDEWEFLYVYEGCAVFSVNGEKRLLKKDDAVLIPGSSMHMAEPVDNCECHYRSIVFSMSMFYGSDDIVQSKYIEPLCTNQIGTGMFLYHGVHHRKGGMIVEFSALFQKIQNILDKRGDAYEMLAKAYLYEALAYVVLSTDIYTKTPGVQDLIGSTQSIKTTIIYMNKNLQKKITVPQLASIVNMSVGHFGKIFKQMTSCSPIEYLLNLRLAKAADKLVYTDEPILCIAMDVGFNNIGHFIRSFEKKYDCTPRQYRKSDGRKQQYIGTLYEGLTL